MSKIRHIYRTCDVCGKELKASWGLLCREFISVLSYLIYGDGSVNRMFDKTDICDRCLTDIKEIISEKRKKENVKSANCD